MHKIHLATCGLITSLLTACASYEPDARKAAVGDAVEQRTGFILPSKFADSPAPISGQLSPEIAARFALQYNPLLQAALEDLNVASAQEVQAGLLVNPTISGQVLFEGDGAQPMLDFGLAFELGRLLTRSRRMGRAEAERRRVEAETVSAIVSAIASARAATINLWAQQQSVDLLRAINVARTSAAKAAQVLADAGNLTAGDLAFYRRAALRSELLLGQAELARIEDIEQLSNVTGTIVADDVVAVLEQQPRRQKTAGDAFIQAAIEKSLTLKAERERIRALGFQVGLANVSVWLDHLEAEVAFEREDGESASGFGATFSLPLFDGGRTRTGAAQAALEASEKRYRARAFAVANRARAILKLLKVTDLAASSYSPQLLQQTQTEFEFETQLFNAMQTGPLKLLGAKAQQLENALIAVDMRRLHLLTSVQAEALEAGVTLETSRMEADTTMISQADGGPHG